MAVAQPLKIDVEITGTCQTCKYWEVGWKHFEDKPLSPLVTNNAYGKCIMVEYAGIVNEVLGNPATIYFGVGDDIQLITNELFGCNQHEPKETEAAKGNH